MTEQERFAIFWCFNRAMSQFNDDKEVIANGVNINQTIRDLLGKLFI
jgi:hypothetical protein